MTIKSQLLNPKITSFKIPKDKIGEVIGPGGKNIKSIKEEFPGVQTYVTLSPKTEMARRFHLKNGAGVYRENSDTVNYIYK
mgnify:CR=1 FL=1